MEENCYLNKSKSEDEELDIAKFQEYRDFRQFTRKPEDNFITFISEYENLVFKIESAICDKNIKILELLLACNLDSDDVKTIFENLKNDKSAISYSAVKTSILEIAAELDQLEDNSEIINDDKYSNQDNEDTAEIRYEYKAEPDVVLKKELDCTEEEAEISTNSEDDPCLIKFSKEERETTAKEKKKARNREWARRERMKMKPKQKHKCEECGVMVVLLSHHMKQVHTPKVACEICGKFFTKYNLRGHIKIHRTPEMKCDQCDYLTVTAERLKGHIERCHGPKNFACEICGSQFGTSLALRWHINNTHNSSLKCTYCDHVTSNYESLKKHIMYKHEKSAKCVCVLCNFETEDKDTLETHIREYHGGLGTKIENKPKRSYDCDLCDYKGNGKNQLRMHKNTKHFGIRFNCDQCDFTATQRGQVTKHVERVHLGIKHPCKFCEDEFSNQSSLRIHMMSKHPDEYQIFSCHLCNYRTESKDRLQRHLTGKYGKHNS